MPCLRTQGFNLSNLVPEPAGLVCKLYTNHHMSVNSEQKAMPQTEVYSKPFIIVFATSSQVAGYVFFCCSGS